MNTMIFHKIPALAFVSILSFATGCTNYGGGTYGSGLNGSSGYGSGTYVSGTGTTTSANMGLTTDLIKNVAPLLSTIRRSTKGSTDQSIRSLEKDAKRQEREARIRQRKEQLANRQQQREEQKEQKRAEYKAERAARDEKERQRLAAMTPEERKKEAEIKLKELELGVEIFKGLMSQPTHNADGCPIGYRYWSGQCIR